MIDNGNSSANGIGALTQLVVPPAPALDAPAAVDASPETLLFRADLLSPDQLGELVQERVSSGRTVEEIVVERGWLDAETVARVLGGTPAAPAPAPHPDPFALPVVAPPAEPVPVASFASPEHPVAIETPPDPFVPVAQYVAVEPAVIELASFSSPVVDEPVETVQLQTAPLVLEPALVEPAFVEPVVWEQAPEPSSTGFEFRVSIRFVGNDCVELAAYPDAVAAKAAAHTLVTELSSERGNWPFVAGRFVRPDAVLSVDIDAIVR